MHYGAIILGKAHSGVAILTLHYGAKILRKAHSGVAFFFIFSVLYIKTGLNRVTMAGTCQEAS